MTHIVMFLLIICHVFLVSSYFSAVSVGVLNEFESHLIMSFSKLMKAFSSCRNHVTRSLTDKN